MLVDNSASGILQLFGKDGPVLSIDLAGCLHHGKAAGAAEDPCGVVF